MDNIVDSGTPEEANGPRAAPFYWGIKESAEPGDPSQKDKPMLKLLQEKYIRTPYFMDKDNIGSFQGSPELWMGANGTGAKAHMDSHCQSTISIQLSGRRRWRLGIIPKDVDRSLKEQFYDGSIYVRGKKGKQGTCMWWSNINIY